MWWSWRSHCVNLTIFWFWCRDIFSHCILTILSLTCLDPTLPGHGGTSSTLFSHLICYIAYQPHHICNDPKNDMHGPSHRDIPFINRVKFDNAISHHILSLFCFICFICHLFYAPPKYTKSDLFDQAKFHLHTDLQKNIHIMCRSWYNWPKNKNHQENAPHNTYTHMGNRCCLTI